MKRKTKRMKPVRAWAIVNGNKLAMIARAPLIYGTKRDAWLDSEYAQRIARVEIREVSK